MAGKYSGRTSTRRTRTYDAGADSAAFDAIEEDMLAKADLDSPGFTGVPTAPTAANGTSTTQIATTAFVLANASGRWGFILGSLSNQLDLMAALDGKADVSHTHSYMSLTDLPTLFSGVYSDLSGIPTTFPPDAHTHTYASLTGLPTLGTAAAANVGDFAAALHGHTQAEVLDLVADLAGKQPVGIYATGAQGALADTAVQPAALATKQDALVSGTNIKTINGVTILGSGDLVVSGGGGGSPIMSWMI